MHEKCISLLFFSVQYLFIYFCIYYLRKGVESGGHFDLYRCHGDTQALFSVTSTATSKPCHCDVTVDVTVIWHWCITSKHSDMAKGYKYSQQTACEHNTDYTVTNWPRAESRSIFERPERQRIQLEHFSTTNTLHLSFSPLVKSYWTFSRTRTSQLTKCRT